MLLRCIRTCDNVVGPVVLLKDARVPERCASHRGRVQQRLPERVCPRPCVMVCAHNAHGAGANRQVEVVLAVYKGGICGLLKARWRHQIGVRASASIGYRISQEDTAEDASPLRRGAAWRPTGSPRAHQVPHGGGVLVRL